MKKKQRGGRSNKDMTRESIENFPIKNKEDVTVAFDGKTMSGLDYYHYMEDQLIHGYRS
jgi:hypothetical protein